MTVGRWSGRETRILREAKRMSLREFAAYLGVSARTVSKWEAAGERLQPRPDTQALLDTALAQATDEVRVRFRLLAGATTGTPYDAAVTPDVGRPAVLADKHLQHPTTGKVMALVAAGPFPFGHDRRAVELPAYYVDLTPVTNADYQRFVAATGYPAPGHWTNGLCPEHLHDHPVVYVSHRDAEAYCRWAGTMLPTEQQWEKAARGEHGQTYPWGDQPTVAKCNVRECGIGRTTPVDRYHSGVSPYGVYDLSGNVWEWCSTQTEPGRYVLKGSAFTSPFSMAAAAATNDASADMLDDDTGFRCAVPADELTP